MNPLDQTTVGGLDFVAAGAGLQAEDPIGFGPIHAIVYRGLRSILPLGVRLVAPTRIGMTIQIGFQHRRRLRIGLAPHQSSNNSGRVRSCRERLAKRPSRTVPDMTPEV